MNNDVIENLKEQSIWLRGLYMIMFAVVYSVAEVVLYATVIFQFLIKLFTNETNPRLLKLGQSISTYIYQILQFLTFNSEHLPYPYGAWPRSEPTDLKKRDNTKKSDA